jgi:nucleoside-diphosphate-sugar epimerase
MAAFVTGGSGFIGGRLVERLVSEGTAVRALVRSEAAAERVRELGGEPVRGDLGEPASIAAGAQGCDVAFHLAAHLGEWGAWEEFPLSGAPPMTTFRSWLLTQECTIDISKAREELGYAPIVSQEQGLAELRSG